MPVRSSHIHPPAALKVESNPTKRQAQHNQSRKDYYDWQAQNLPIEGIIQAVRDTVFDDTDAYRSDGIRVMYSSHTRGLTGVKDGILMEVGLDNIAPNQLRTISSWA